MSENFKFIFWVIEFMQNFQNNLSLFLFLQKQYFPSHYLVMQELKFVVLSEGQTRDSFLSHI